ncbi:hypothetical protein PspLS_07127 [Pyricularia sp. CBS 133598]|nr:hypothetical protein PspLS_07127 [Pyricularia sp. CBS 133598]
MFFCNFVLGFTLLSLTGNVLAGVEDDFVYKHRLFVPSLLPPEKVRMNNGVLRLPQDIFARGYADRNMAFSDAQRMSDAVTGGSNKGTFYYYRVNTTGYGAFLSYIKNQNPGDHKYEWDAHTRVFGADHYPWARITAWTRVPPYPYPRWTTQKVDWEKKNPFKPYDPSSSQAHQQAPAHSRPSSQASGRAPDYGPSSSRTPAQAPAYGRSRSSTSQEPTAHYSPSIPAAFPADHPVAQPRPPLRADTPSSSRGPAPPSAYGTPSRPPPPPPTRDDTPSSSQRPAGPPVFYRPFTEEIGFVQGPGSMINDYHFPPWNPQRGMPPIRRPPLPPPPSY